MSFYTEAHIFYSLHDHRVDSEYYQIDCSVCIHKLHVLIWCCQELPHLRASRRSCMRVNSTSSTPTNYLQMVDLPRLLLCKYRHTMCMWCEPLAQNGYCTYILEHDLKVCVNHHVTILP